MREKSSILIPLGIALVLMLGGYFVISGMKSAIKQEPEPEQSFGGQSIVVRDVIGTHGSPTSSSSAPVQLNAGNDLSAVTTSTATTTLFQYTDAVLVTITQPEASSSNSLYWHIMGSNDWEACNAIGTSTTDDSYVATYPLKEDIHWYDLIPDDVTPSGYDNHGNVDISSTGYTADLNASSTSFLLTDMNWTCLKTEYRGASTTVLMQIREKVLTTP